MTLLGVWSIFIGANSLRADWSFTTLHPSGATKSVLTAGKAAQQVGYIVTASGASRAAVWSDTAGSFVDLDPSGAYVSTSYATNGVQQGGGYSTAASPWGEATLWSGTPESRVSLHPPGAFRSMIMAMSGNFQGGVVFPTSQAQHAAIWSGTAGSFVDMNPAGYDGSIITAMAGSQQAGYGLLSGGSRRALLWNGSASNVVSLHPNGANFSAVYAMTETQQGGGASLPFSPSSKERAVLWSGTAASWVDLHPSGAATSQVLAMAGEYQAGQVDDKAAVWHGNVGSWVNLHTAVAAQLGANYTKSVVNGAYLNGGAVVLVGLAQDTVTNKTVAIMWTNSGASLAPAIVTAPQSQTANAGASASFTVVVTGTEPLTYQWRRDGVPVGSSSPLLSLNNLTQADAGAYDVVVSNTAGSISSVAATLTVAPVAGGGARRVLSPGDSVSLNVAMAVSGAPTYQWLHNFSAMPGENAAVLQLVNVTYAASGHYQLVVTDAGGVRRSATIFVTVAPPITESISWGINDYGQTTLPSGLNDAVAVALGAGHVLALRRDGTVIAWGRNNVGQATVPANLSDVVAIAAGGTFSMALTADGKVVQWGKHYTELKPIPEGLDAVVAIDAGSSRAVALRADGTAVAWGDSKSSGVNYMLADLANRAVAAGDTQTMALKQDGTVRVDDGGSVTANSNIPAGLSGVVAIAAAHDRNVALRSDGTVVRWGYDKPWDTPLPAGLQNVTAIRASSNNEVALKSDQTLTLWGNDSAFLKNTPTTAVSVFAFDIDGETIVALRDAQAQSVPIFYAPVPDRSTPMGQSVTFTAMAGGNPGIAYRWQRQAAGDSTWRDIVSNATYSGTTSGALSIAAPTFEMNGDQFRCVATNTLGSTYSNAAVLTITIPLPVITRSPLSPVVALGSSFQVDVLVTSYAPLSYEWLRNGYPILGVNSAVYSVASAQLSDAGFYSVRVTNSAGSVTSFSGNVIVVPLPSVTSQPQSQTVFTRAKLELSVVATSQVPSSYAPLSYAWYKNNEPIAGAGGQRYVVNLAQASDAGDYHVRVTNLTGSIDSQVATIAIDPRTVPVFSQHPSASSVLVGMPAQFSVMAEADPMPAYQWQKVPAGGGGNWVDVVDGTNYSGAQSPTLTVLNSTLDNQGDQFRCIASNVAGRTTSNSAMLAVTTPGYLKISAGRYHSLRVNLVSRVYGTGQNAQGQLGLGNTTDVLLAQPVTLPGQTITDVAAGAEHSLFLTSAKEAWGTGLNATGQLGDGTNTARSMPIKMATNVAGIAAGRFHSVILKTDGSLWAVGGNDSGQLGTGTTTDTSTLVQIATEVVDMAAGIRQTLFIKSDGTLWGMGDMNGSGVAVATPVQIASNIKAVAAGGYHSLFLKTDGTLWTMGYNPYGQLGNGTTADSSTPVQIATGVKWIAAGYFHSAFIKANGSLWVMGYNSGGQLGNGTQTNAFAPVQVATGVFAVSASEAYTLFVKVDGTLWGTGYNAYGQFGNGTSTTSKVPVLIDSGVYIQPAAPVGLAAATVVNQDLVHLSWQPAAEAVDYEVWRGTTNDAVPALRVAQGLRWPIYQDRTASGGADYYYWITAVNPAGPSGFSATVAGSADGIGAVGPTITMPPQSQMVDAGSDVSFSVVADGTAPLSYQWRKGGENLDGATNDTYTIDDVNAGDVGGYDVVVSNTMGSVTSDPAVLTVNALAQTITFAALANRSYDPMPIPLVATASSGLPVDFAVVTGPATMSGNNLMLTGIGEIRVQATQLGNAVYAAAIPVDRIFTVTGHLSWWRLTHFTPQELEEEAISGSDADPDGDGLANLLEYALGLDPQEANSSGLPEVTTLAADWVYTYMKPASITDVSYAVERTADLNTWTTEGIVMELVSSESGMETWRATYPLSSTATIFFRLRVTE